MQLWNMAAKEEGVTVLKILKCLEQFTYPGVVLPWLVDCIVIYSWEPNVILYSFNADENAQIINAMLQLVKQAKRWLVSIDASRENPRTSFSRCTRPW